MARRAGFQDVAEALGIEAADFSKGVEVPFPDGDMIKRFTIAQSVMDADGMVSLPKMKTHGLTRITGALKNQFGCIPGVLKAEFHARLPNADLFSRMLVDLNRLLRPRLFVLDAVVAMEGNGPQSGTPRRMGLLAFSEDPVALDATICELVALDPALVLPVVYGDRAGLGRMSDFPWIGDPLAAFIADDFQVNRSPRSTTGRPGRLSRIARRLVVPKPAIRSERCTRCGTCVAICPVDPKAVQFRQPASGKAPEHNYARCIRCYCCQELCPAEAIEIRTPLLGHLIHRG
jgi:Pyruvate/2-oxoacid:ferredoxin oxidoreductase delta subunit